jgi:hypothetical protein
MTNYSIANFIHTGADNKVVTLINRDNTVSKSFNVGYYVNTAVNENVLIIYLVNNQFNLPFNSKGEANLALSKLITQIELSKNNYINGVSYGLVGPKGITGPVGPIGPTGPQGEIGSTGPQGEIGSTGPQGEIGSTGPQGEIGSTGPQGKSFTTLYSTTTYSIINTPTSYTFLPDANFWDSVLSQELFDNSQGFYLQANLPLLSDVDGLVLGVISNDTYSDYLIYLNGNNYSFVDEGLTLISSGTYSEGDLFSLYNDGSQIYYKINSNTILSVNFTVGNYSFFSSPFSFNTQPLLNTYTFSNVLFYPTGKAGSKYNSVINDYFAVPEVDQIINTTTLPNLGFTTDQIVLIKSSDLNYVELYYDDNDNSELLFYAKVDSYDLNTGNISLITILSKNIGLTSSFWSISLSGEPGIEGKIGPTGSSYFGISDTYLSIPDIEEVVILNTQPNLGFSPNQTVLVKSDLVNYANFYYNDNDDQELLFYGNVDYYDKNTGVLSLITTYSKNIGLTSNSWYINLSGEFNNTIGPTGPQGIQGIQGNTGSTGPGYYGTSNTYLTTPDINEVVQLYTQPNLGFSLGQYVHVFSSNSFIENYYADNLSISSSAEFYGKVDSYHTDDGRLGILVTKNKNIGYTSSNWYINLSGYEGPIGPTGSSYYGISNTLFKVPESQSVIELNTQPDLGFTTNQILYIYTSQNLYNSHYFIDFGDTIGSFYCSVDNYDSITGDLSVFVISSENVGLESDLWYINLSGNVGAIGAVGATGPGYLGISNTYLGVPTSGEIIRLNTQTNLGYSPNQTVLVYSILENIYSTSHYFSDGTASLVGKFSALIDDYTPSTGDLSLYILSSENIGLTSSNWLINLSAESSNSGGSSLTTVTKSELDTLITNSGLITGANYLITGVNPDLYGGTDIILQATSTNSLSISGKGKFYNPKYDQSIAGYGIWNNLSTWATALTSGTFQPNETVTGNNGATAQLFSNLDANEFIDLGTGDWTAASTITGNSSGATANIRSVTLKTYAIGDKAIWGGMVWTNTTGNVGSSTDVLSLDDTNWTVIDYNTTDYNIVWDEIQYDYSNDLIVYRKDKANNVVSTSKGNEQYNNDNYSEYPTIALFQWGNDYDYFENVGVGNNIVDGSYVESVNFCGSTFIFNSFTENSLYQRNSTDFSSYFNNNTLSSNSGFIDNTLSNSGFGSNTLSNGSFYNNTLNRSSFYNNTLSNSGFGSNTLSSGSFDNNTLSNSGFGSNTIRSGSFNNNTLSSGSFDNNTLNRSSFYNNTLSNSSFNNNTLNRGSFYNNILSNSSFYNNTLNLGSFSSNTLSNNSSFYSNTLSNNSSFYSNTLSSNSSFNSNTLSSSSFYSNTLSSNSTLQNCSLNDGSSNYIQYNSLLGSSSINGVVMQGGSTIESNTLTEQSSYNGVTISGGVVFKWNKIQLNFAYYTTPQTTNITKQIFQ